MAKRRRRKRLEGKYVFRRFLMIALVLAALIGGTFYAGYRLAGKDPAPAEAVMAPTPSESSSQPSSSSESSEEPDDNEEPSDAGPELTPEEEAAEKAALEAEQAKEAAAAKAKDWNLILVNKQSPLPEDFSVELETVVGDYKVDARIRDALLRMMAGAKEDGITLQICSAYRSEEKQTTNFDNYKNNLVDNGMEEEEAIATTATIIAHPGTSEHHTGLAVDIVTPDYQDLDEGFERTPAFEWLDKNAEKYGFILRFPKMKQSITEIIYEPWHYRYVGMEDAKKINELGYCLEEYVYKLNTGGLDPVGEESPEEEGADDESTDE